MNCKTKQRDQILKKKAFERDNFTCQKCRIQDKTTKILEVHHIIPLIFGGRDELDNLITLCSDCHKYAPNKKEEFEEYMREETTGTATILMKSIEKIREEHPELFDEDLFNKVREKLDKS